MSDELENGSEVLLLKSICVFRAEVPSEDEELNKAADFT